MKPGFTHFKRYAVVLLTVFALGGGVTLNFLFAVPAAQAQVQERHLYLAQWEWFCESADNCYWRAPGGDALGALDLRAIPAMSKPGGTPEGYGLFTYDRQVSIPGSMYLGDSLDDVLLPPQKAQVRTALNITGPIQSDTVKDILWDILTVHSDPTGKAGPKPLQGKLGETVKLYLGGFSLIKEEPFNEEHKQRTIEVFKEDYKRNKADGVPLETLQRWTGSTMKDLYGKMDDETAERILPQEHKADKWKEPHTTITDNFNRTDADALGTSSEGWSWTEVLSDIDILSNRAVIGSVSGYVAARAESDLSSADHYSQALAVSFSAANDRIGVGVRYSASADTHYLYLVYQIPTVHRLIKVVTGTATNLAFDDTNAPSDGNTIYIEANGSALVGKVNGITRLTVTDTAVTSNLRTGLRGFTINTGTLKWDDFQAGDLNITPASPTSPTQLKTDASTAISNGGYTNETSMLVRASATDADTTEIINLFFELVANASSFTSTATPTVASSCASGTAFSSCANKVWYVTSSSGNYSSTAFTGTATVAGLSDATGYKWQVKACDDSSACSAWVAFNASTPNFTVDTTVPTTPGTPSTTSPTTSQTPTWTWIVSTDAGSGLHSTEAYIVEWSTDSSFASGVSSSTASAASFTHSTNLIDETTWYFRVTAQDAASNQSSVSPNGVVAVDTTPPPGPGPSTASGNAGAGTAYLQQQGFLPAPPSPEPPPTKPDFGHEEVGLQPADQAVIESIREATENVFQRAREIARQIPGVFPETEPPAFTEATPDEEPVPEEVPLVFQGKWQLLPEQPIREFVFAPLPKEITRLADKFPQLAQTLEQVGISSLKDLQRLQTAKLTLPGLAQLTQLQSDIPTEIVFAGYKSAPGTAPIDMPAVLTVTDQGEPQQRITTIAGKPLHLTVKPEQPANSVKGYLVFRSKESSARTTESAVLAPSLLASAFFAQPVFAQTYDPEDMETRLVLLEFEYTGPDQDGLYTADIVAPVVEGEYEIISVIEYEDPELGTRAIRLITVVDPEGYVYERSGDREIRVPGAIVSLYWLNPSSSDYALWPGKDYQQENPQITDITGKYSFLTPQGTYYLKVEASGYPAYQSDVFEVKEGSGIHQNIELKTKYWWLGIIGWERAVLILVVLLLLLNFWRDKMRKRTMKHET